MSKNPHSAAIPFTPEAAMSNPLSLLFSCLFCALLSGLVLRFLNQPLRGLLERLCPNQSAAAFWQSYTQLMLMLAPLLCVLTLDLLVHGDDLFIRLRYTLITALGGLLLGLWIVGKRLSRFIDRVELIERAQ